MDGLDPECVSANTEMTIFAETKCDFSSVSAAVFKSLIHYFTCRFLSAKPEFISSFRLDGRKCQVSLFKGYTRLTAFFWHYLFGEKLQNRIGVDIHSANHENDCRLLNPPTKTQREIIEQFGFNPDAFGCV